MNFRGLAAIKKGAKLLLSNFRFLIRKYLTESQFLLIFIALFLEMLSHVMKISNHHLKNIF